MKRVNGFTLIEVLLVVVILAILAAILIPGVQNYIARAHLAELYTLISTINTEEDLALAESDVYLGTTTPAIQDYMTRVGRRWDITGLAANTNVDYTISMTKRVQPGQNAQLTYNRTSGNVVVRTGTYAGWQVP